MCGERHQTSAAVEVFQTAGLKEPAHPKRPITGCSLADHGSVIGTTMQVPYESYVI